MSKIICDICGTSYPETSQQCPICGCVRPGDVQRVTNEVKTEGDVATGYTYVKGGRFSKSNVKKRSKNKQLATEPRKEPRRKKPENEKPVEMKQEVKKQQKQNTEAKKTEKKSNIGLTITAVLLLLAIIAVVVYIAVRFFGPIIEPPVDPTIDPTKEPTIEQEILCTNIKLDAESLIFNQKGSGRLLSVTKVPANATENVTYRSENEAVAVVTADGMITAVGKGQTKIIITCGNIVKECVIDCQIEEDVTDPTDPSTPSNPTEPSEPSNPTDPSTDPTQPQEIIRLNRSDITFSYDGEAWLLYSGNVDKSLVTFSSDNESIVTFVDGKVVAIGPGTTYVHAVYGNQKASCIIRCAFEESGGVGGNGGVGEDGGSVTYAIYTQYGDKTRDITIREGEVVYLYLKDSNGNTVVGTWSVNGTGCTISENKVTGATAGTISTVTVTYEEKNYTCTVRVTGAN